MNNLLAAGKSVLCEVRRGQCWTLISVLIRLSASSNTVCAGACTGLGIAPNKIGEVYGIFKAYCTRVGAGPFPTELFDKTGDQICTLGHEFGSVTGRKRRCGWIDLVALKYAIMVDGVTKLIMMKSDVLDSFETIKACVAYKVNGEEIDYFPVRYRRRGTGVRGIARLADGYDKDAERRRIPRRIQCLSVVPGRAEREQKQ